MSALLFHPNIDFDFARKPPKSKLPAQIIGAVFVTLLFIASIFGFARLELLAPHSTALAAREISSQYSNSAEPLNLHSLVNSSEPISTVVNLPAAPTVNITDHVPILMYHYTPPNFEDQLLHLQAHGYHTITMSELAHHLYIDAPLPDKPVVITFDDGFLDQLRAFELLKKYNMKATFYLILGGDESNHCIGITRTNLRCGDDYLNWSQAKNLSDSGLVEIGAHTLNHPDLPTLSPERQWEEISESKKRLETMYDINITSFAYPYGRYNQTSIDDVARAGFLTAVTTEPGENQSSSGRYLMPRVRNALLLP